MANASILTTHDVSVFNSNIRSKIMKSIQQKSTMVDLMIWVAIFGIQAGVAILTYAQYTAAQLMA
jgi:hypothetical protein